MKYINLIIITTLAIGAGELQSKSKEGAVAAWLQQHLNQTLNISGVTPFSQKDLDASVEKIKQMVQKLSNALPKEEPGKETYTKQLETINELICNLPITPAILVEILREVTFLFVEAREQIVSVGFILINLVGFLGGTITNVINQITEPTFNDIYPLLISLIRVILPLETILAFTALGDTTTETIVNIITSLLDIVIEHLEAAEKGKTFTQNPEITQELIQEILIDIIDELQVILKPSFLLIFDIFVTDTLKNSLYDLFPIPTRIDLLEIFEVFLINFDVANQIDEAFDRLNERLEELQNRIESKSKKTRARITFKEQENTDRAKQQKPLPSFGKPTQNTTTLGQAMQKLQEHINKLNEQKELETENKPGLVNNEEIKLEPEQEKPESETFEKNDSDSEENIENDSNQSTIKEINEELKEILEKQVIDEVDEEDECIQTLLSTQIEAIADLVGNFADALPQAVDTIQELFLNGTQRIFDALLDPRLAQSIEETRLIVEESMIPADIEDLILTPILNLLFFLEKQLLIIAGLEESNGLDDIFFEADCIVERALRN